MFDTARGKDGWGKGGHQDKPPSLYLCKQAIEARPRPSVGHNSTARGIDPLDGRGQSTQMLPYNDDVCTVVHPSSLDLIEDVCRGWR